MIGAIAIMMASVSNVYAVMNSTSNVGKSLENQIGDLRLNPYFAPDESCMFDAFQLHCIPGEYNHADYNSSLRQAP